MNVRKRAAVRNRPSSLALIHYRCALFSVRGLAGPKWAHGAKHRPAIIIGGAVFRGGVSDRRYSCADCDMIVSSAYFSQTTASQGGYHLLPYGAPGPPALGGDASSTPFNGVRRGCFHCCQSRQFATTPAGCHRVDLHRLSDSSPESGPAGDRIPGVARCGFGIPPASFLPG
jgi:hypothetical protein